MNLPKTLRGKTVEWFLREGLDLVKVLEVKMVAAEVVQGEEDGEFCLVLCLGVDRREGVARRLGMFCLPKRTWEMARPKIGTVIMG